MTEEEKLKLIWDWLEHWYSELTKPNAGLRVHEFCWALECLLGTLRKED